MLFRRFKRFGERLASASINVKGGSSMPGNYSALAMGDHQSIASYHRFTLAPGRHGLFGELPGNPGLA